MGREQLENTQGKITIQKGEPTYSQNIPVECKLMFSTLCYFHVEFFFFFCPESLISMADKAFEHRTACSLRGLLQHWKKDLNEGARQ